MAHKNYRFVPEQCETGMRLDQFISSRNSELSRTMVRKIVDLGGVHVGGRRMRRCSSPVKAGETVEVFLDGSPLEPYRLGAEAILWRDRYMIAIDKPAGIETQPTPARFKGTIYSSLIDFLHDPFRPQQPPELGMVQRLDRDTTGVMVFSIHPRAHGGLTRVFTSREIVKRYLAFVAGRMQGQEGEFRSMLARSRSNNRVKSVDRGGKEAITRYRVLEAFAEASLVEVEILTGRSHQIRAHFAESGHPLLGDERYGGPRDWKGYPIGRQMLHSWSLSFAHPVSAEPLLLEAQVHSDMAELLAAMRGS